MMASSQLIWDCLRSFDSKAVRKDGVTFTRDAASLTGRHAYNQPSAQKHVTVTSTKGTRKANFKAVEAKVAASGRHELRAAALARASKLLRSVRLGKLAGHWHEEDHYSSGNDLVSVLVHC